MPWNTKTSKILFVLAIFLFGHQVSYAASYQQVYPTISSTGAVSSLSTKVTGCTNVYGYRDYRGDYPATTTLFASGSLNAAPTILDSSTLEGGWLNGAAVTPDDHYWSSFTCTGSAYTPDWNGTVYFFVGYRSASSWYAPGAPTGAYTSPTVTINDPLPYGTTTASTSVGINISYVMPASFDSRPTTTRVFTISDAVSGITQYVYAHVVPANTTESVTISPTLNLSTGSKILTAYYAQGAYSTSTIASTTPLSYSQVKDTFFNVVNNTYLLATGLENPKASTASTTQNNCAITDIGCQFQRALVFVFYPSQPALDRFAGTWSELSTKKPFGYITITAQELTQLDMNANPAFSISTSTMPFWSTIFTPMRTALAAILWAVFAIYFFLHRLRHIEI